MSVQLECLLAALPRPVELVVHGLDDEWIAALRLPADTRVTSPSHEYPRALTPSADPPVPAAASVVLAVRDRGHLRRAASVLSARARCRTVACWVEISGGRALSVTPRPEWPVLASCVTECQDSAFLRVGFAAPVQARDVLVEVARATVLPSLSRAGGPVVTTVPQCPELWPPGDSRTRLVTGPPDPEDLPPSTVVAPRHRVVPTDVGSASTVSDGPRVQVLGETAPTWADCAREASWARATPAELGPLDEALLNPGGYQRLWSHDSVDLVPGPTPWHLAVQTAGRDHLIDSRRGVSDEDIRVLRTVQSVNVTWRGGRGPHDHARVVVGLAMAGIPLTATSPPSWARRLIDPAVLGCLHGAVDLSTPLAREAHSVRVRREALHRHSTPAWRARVSRLPRSLPTVSVLLATRRPEQVPFALRQVRAQQGVAVELVLVTHGFALGDPEREQVLRSCPVARIVEAPSEAVFGEVLNLGVSAASGELILKMDDDDWYGPRFAADLVLARMYSGAPLVGCPAEFIHVGPLDVTIRRPDRTELHGDFIAGGTMLIHRTDLEEVGGFRRYRRSVDAGLLADVRQSGGSVYRSHGLNYLLRRGSSGHTWDPGLQYFVSRSRVTDQWRGFRPPPGVTPDRADVPAPSAMTRTP